MKVDFHCLTRFWLRTLTHVNFDHVNKTEARQKELNLNQKFNEVQLLRLRATFPHWLYFICHRNFYARKHVKITRHWKSTRGFSLSPHFTCVNETEEMHERSRVSVKVERGLTFTVEIHIW